MVKNDNLPPKWVHRATSGSLLEKQFLYEEIFVSKSYIKHGISIPSENGCIIDCGANVGFFSCFAAEQEPSSHIIALEPIKNTYDKLRYNVKVHQEWCQGEKKPVGKVTPLCLGLTSTATVARHTNDTLPRDEALPSSDRMYPNDIIHQSSTKAEFVYYPRALGWGTMGTVEDRAQVRRDLKQFVDNAISLQCHHSSTQQSPHALPASLIVIGSFLKTWMGPVYTLVVMLVTSIMLSGARTVSCDVCTLSQLIRAYALDDVHLLKIDVERSELEVLRGIESEEDWKKIHQIVAEVHEQNVDECMELLRGPGQFNSVVKEQTPDFQGTSLYMVFATRNKHSNGETVKQYGI